MRELMETIIVMAGGIGVIACGLGVCLVLLGGALAISAQILDLMGF